MVKFFCDVCGADITGHANDRLKGRTGRISFEVITGVDGIWNGGHICRQCLIAAINAAQHGVQPTREAAQDEQPLTSRTSSTVAGG